MGGLVAAAGAAGLPTGSAAAATTRRGIEFDRVVDVVDDLGCDPTGNDPIQWKLNNADQEGTLFRFPDGEYLVSDRLLFRGNDAVGFLGEGDARFVVPDRYNDWALIANGGHRLLFENIDVDLRADGATPGFRLGVYDHAEIHDVEFIGQGIHPNSDPRGKGDGNPEVTRALALVAHNSDSTILVENFVARNDGLMGAYNHGDGRVGVSVGSNTEGTVTLRDCHVSGFPNNGLYTSRTPGVVQVEGGVFRNNDISQVRLGSKGSYVEGAFIEVDPAKSNSPNPDDMLNGRGVRIESGRVDTAGVTVRDCDIRIAEGANSGGGVVAASPAGGFDVVDTRIRVDADGVYGVRGKEPESSGSYAPPWPRSARLTNVSITGSADRGQAILLDHRRKSMIDSCCIDQTGTNRDGIKLESSGETTIKNSTVNVSGETFDLGSGDVNTWGNSTGGSCPTPGQSGPSTTGDGGNDDNGGDSDGDSSGSNETKRIELRGNSDGVSYTVKVSGDISKTDSSSSETVSGSTASGSVSTWVDAYEYTGEIEQLLVKGAATFRYDRSEETLVFTDNRSGSKVAYTVVGENLSTTPTSVPDGKPEGADDGQRVRGALYNWKDRYDCSGGLVSVEVDDGFSVDVS